MASSVFYKWGSRKDESRVTFDGTGISVFDLKREIIIANNMGKANDFDLVVLDATSKQEFKDDSQVIPRSSSVTVKRIPAARPGKGKASMYLAGLTGAVPTSDPITKSGASTNGVTWHKGAMSKRFDVKDEQPSSALNKLTSSGIKTAIADEDEQAAVAAMFQAQTANWEETQEKMSQLVFPYMGAQRIYTNPRGTGFSRGGKPHTPHVAPQIDRPLPPSYVCYRCGQKGHWIQDCPTNNDRDFDNKPRIKRTTGIPRSMLKAVTTPTSGELGQGVMVTPEGGYVVAQPDLCVVSFKNRRLASWQKQVSRVKALSVADVRERTPLDSSLVCPIDNKLFRDAVKTPCCGTLYCEECIQTHLLERDFICPSCAKKIASLDKLIVDKPTRIKVADYIEKAIEDSKKEGEEELTQKDGTSGNNEQSTHEQDFYSDQQPDLNMDMSQMVVDSIPQLQAQISQISLMLQNPSLPNQQSAGQDSAYQRLPLNNRRRNLKRERPSDFLEIGGETDNKMARYWE
ncbi:hypothetical protein J132_06463 [Termitomyces sp. J132]|nr:hypothetical protein J132_06463 [Termitomyces sp. J132]